MTNHDPDRWLDSVVASDLDRADAAQTTRSTAHVLRALGRAEAEPLVGPPRLGPSLGRGRWLMAASVAAALLWLALPTRRDVDVRTMPTPTRLEATSPVWTPVAVPAASLAGPAEAARGVAAAAPTPARPDRADPLEPERGLAPVSPVAPTSSPEFGAGLTSFEDTQVEHLGAEAVLVRGSLRFLRDADHDPGVTRVVIRDLPLLIDPVGTEFLVGACAGGAAVMVQHGRVFLRRHDGEPLAEVREGESMLVLAEPSSADGLAIESITSLGLEGVSSAAAAHPHVRPSDVLAMVARLRLIGLGDAPVHELLRSNP